MTTEEIRKQLLEKRILTIFDEINDKSVHETRGDMLQLIMKSADPIHFVFNSEGGLVQPALDMYDAMQLFDGRVPMIGVVVGRCSSSATFILLGCSQRLALPHSRFLLHHIETTFKYCPENLNVMGQFQKSLEDAKKLTNQLIAVYSDRCGCSKPAARKWLENGRRYDHLLDSDEAKEIGLITEVVKTYPPIADYLVGLAQSLKEAP